MFFIVIIIQCYKFLNILFKNEVTLGPEKLATAPPCVYALPFAQP